MVHNSRKLSSKLGRKLSFIYIGDQLYFEKKPRSKVGWSVAGLSPRRIAFDVRSAHDRFVVEKLALT